jgi:Ras superfamily GTP-binding protein YlqF
VAEAWRRVRRVVEDSDVVVEVLDARDPAATRNSDVEKLARSLGKRLMAAINKADLVPLEIGLKWKRWLESQGVPSVFLSARERLGTRKLVAYIKRLAPSIPVKVAVVGYPNVGKSTIINYLKGRHVASTSPKPGWTRGEQLVRAKSWLLVVDTPGVLAAEGAEDPALAVIRGAVDPGRVDDAVPYAVALIERVIKLNPKALEAYGLASAPSAEEALELIAQKVRTPYEGRPRKCGRSGQEGFEGLDRGEAHLLVRARQAASSSLRSRSYTSPLGALSLNNCASKT